MPRRGPCVSTLILIILIRSFFLPPRLFASALSNSDIPSATSPSIGTSQPIIDSSAIRASILSGHVYIHPHFLDEGEISLLLSDMRKNEHMFSKSGLSDTTRGLGEKGSQGFGHTDREVAPVSWWASSLGGGEVPAPLREISSKIQSLRVFFSASLGRLSMSDTGLAHELYYSTSRRGAYLPRHLDEHAEELKGSRGWLAASRRSITWMIYLSDPGWTEKCGGILRCYPQRQRVAGKTGDSVYGDLQVGWIALGGHKGSASMVRPVFLDPWRPVGPDREMHCALYYLEEGVKEGGVGNIISEGKRTYVTEPWLSERAILAHGSLYTFLKKASETDASKGIAGTERVFLSTSFAHNFYLVEDREQWHLPQRGESNELSPPRGSDTIDVLPQRGTLVAFDSVSLPHEVTEVLSLDKTRVAVAGWFHEEAQGFPVVDIAGDGSISL